MKKILALVMALCLLCSVAMASEVTWADIEPQLAENGLTGDYVVLDQLGLKIWLPTGLNPAEATEEGRLAAFVSEDGTSYVVVDAVNAEGMSVELLYDSLKSNDGFSDVEMASANGLVFVVSKNVNENYWSSALVDTNCNIIEFNVGPDEEGAKDVFSIIVASIQGI